MYGQPFNDPVEFGRVVDYAVECLQGVTFDTLVFRGFSGALVGTPVALRLSKPWALVRKPGDTAHSGRRLEGNVSGKYVILDDFIDTGATVLATVEAIKIVSMVPTECIGVVLYEQSWCRRSVDDRTFWQNKIGGLSILNWKNYTPEPEEVLPEPISSKGWFDWDTLTSEPRFEIKRSSSGPIYFKRPGHNPDPKKDFKRFFPPPPMPASLASLLTEEIAF